MKSNLRAASPPVTPVIFYDGDCRFCRFWIQRWQQSTENRIEYLPFHDTRVARLFPGANTDEFSSAVHLVETDGSVYSGAEAVFRALAQNPEERWPLEWYDHSVVFAGVTECAYRFIARNRSFFSVLTRIGWGDHVERPTYLLVRGAFLKFLALIYLIAFVSLWLQIDGLVGSNGIEPAKLTMSSSQRGADVANLGWDRYHLVPTLCWFADSDGFLQFQCAAGVAAAILLLVGFAPVPCLVLLWLLYLSLATVCREFLSFQWDNLLLETGFLSIFLAPLQLLPRSTNATSPPRLVLWLLRWLLFRLMFASGLVKLLSGDATWHNLTALEFHYETQPLPTWLGWYAHQLPPIVQKISTILMFGIELLIPFLIFAPRRLRFFACAATFSLQVAILLTGNYCFFNLLAIALCLFLLDDAAIRPFWPSQLRTVQVAPLPHASGPESESPSSSAFKSRHLKWPIQITVPLVAIAVVSSLIQFGAMFRLRIPWPKPVLSVYEWLAPFRSFNSYGLFAVMTTTRPEIIIEGSDDRAAWFEYEFKYKPGNLARRPRFVEPHQPRLDWQMWFAALDDYRHDPWIVNFCVRLLQGSPDVLTLLERNPFPKSPPRYVRAVLYEYHFTDLSTRRRTGAWWRRERKGNYLPELSLKELNSSPQ